VQRQRRDGIGIGLAPESMSASGGEDAWARTHDVRRGEGADDQLGVRLRDLRAINVELLALAAKRVALARLQQLRLCAPSERCTARVPGALRVLECVYASLSAAGSSVTGRTASKGPEITHIAGAESSNRRVACALYQVRG
jgi:hypothetical protein